MHLDDPLPQTLSYRLPWCRRLEECARPSPQPWGAACNFRLHVEPADAPSPAATPCLTATGRWPDERVMG